MLNKMTAAEIAERLEKEVCKGCDYEKLAPVDYCLFCGKFYETDAALNKKVTP